MQQISDVYRATTTTTTTTVSVEWMIDIPSRRPAQGIAAGDAT